MKCKLLISVVLLCSAIHVGNPREIDQYRCRTWNSCNQSDLENLAMAGMNEIREQVQEGLENQVKELKDFRNNVSNRVMSNEFSQFIQSNTVYDSSEPDSDLSGEITDGIEYGSSNNDNAIYYKRRVIAYVGVTILKQLLSAIESADKHVNKPIHLLRRALRDRTKRVCVLRNILDTIRDSKQAAGFRDRVDMVIAMLTRFINVVRKLRSSQNLDPLVTNIQEVKEKVSAKHVWIVCLKLFVTNIACRTCNSSISHLPLQRTCHGLCTNTLYACLAPILKALRNSDDVIRVNGILVNRLNGQDNNLRDLVPSVSTVGSMLGNLTRSALELSNTTLNLGRRIFEIAHACNFDMEKYSDNDRALSAVAINAELNEQRNDIWDRRTEISPTIYPTRTVDTDNRMLTEPTQSGRDSRSIDSDSRFNPTSIPNPPKRLEPLIRKIVANLCTGQMNRLYAAPINADQCWNGTQIAVYRSTFDSLDVNTQENNPAFEAAGVAYNEQEYRETVEALTGSTNPCQTLVGTSATYNMISDSTSVCYQEVNTITASSSSTCLRISFALLLLSVFLTIVHIS